MSPSSDGPGGRLNPMITSIFSIGGAATVAVLLKMSNNANIMQNMTEYFFILIQLPCAFFTHN